jgi:hypothetical protein
MPKSNEKQETPDSKERKVSKRKISREQSKRKRLSRLCYGKTTIGRSMSKNRDILYSHYAKTLEAKGNLFADIRRDGIDQTKKQKTRIVRFKKDAKTILQRLLITWLRRICNICKTVCSLEGLSKIKEKNVYTQIRLAYPPSEQDAIITSCQKALKSFIESKTKVSDREIATNTATIE